MSAARPAYGELSPEFDQATPAAAAPSPGAEPSPPDQRTLPGWVVGSATFFTLAFILPTIFTEIALASFANPAVALAGVIIVYAALRLSQLLIHGREQIVQLFFWTFVYIFLGLVALSNVVANRFAIPFQSYDRATQVTGLIGVLVGLVAYDFGCVLGRRSERSSTFVSSLADRYEIAPNRVRVVAVVGILSTAYFTWTTGLGTRFSSRATATAALLGQPVGGGQRFDQIGNKASGLIQISLLWMPAFLSLFLLLYLYRHWRESRRSAPNQSSRFLPKPLATRRLIAVLLVVNLLANNPFSNPRYRFGGVAIALALAVFPLRTPARFRGAVVGVLALVLIVYPYAAAFRFDERYVPTSSLSEQLVSSPDFAMFQQELNGVSYVQDEGHTLGAQTAGAVFGFVPRVIWPSKPGPTGDLVSRTNLITASADLWTESYVEFGWIGLGVVFTVYGWLSRVFDWAYVRRRAGPTVIGAAVPLYAAFQTFLVRGSLQPAVGELAPVAVVFLLCLRRRQPAGHPSGGFPTSRASDATSGSKVA